MPFRRHFLRVIAVPLLALTFVACGGDNNDDTPTEPTPPPPQGPATLQITELAAGEGAEAANGRTAVIGYRLFRFDPNGADQKGEEIPQAPTFTWVVGSNGSIAGMNQGVQGMKVGGKRRLVIPPNLAYGTAGFPPTIRPNEWLVFEIELLAVA